MNTQKVVATAPGRPGTYTTSPPESALHMASLRVVHTCGHIGGYAYGGEVFAKSDGPRMAARVCLGCHSANELARYERERGPLFTRRVEHKH